jgi:hypothetical protein
VSFLDCQQLKSLVRVRVAEFGLDLSGPESFQGKETYHHPLLKLAHRARWTFKILFYSARGSRGLLEHSDFPELMHRNHQLCLLDLFCREMDKQLISSEKPAAIFDITCKNVGENLSRGLQEPHGITHDSPTKNQNPTCGTLAGTVSEPPNPYRERISFYINNHINPILT